MSFKTQNSRTRTNIIHSYKIEYLDLNSYKFTFIILYFLKFIISYRYYIIIINWEKVIINFDRLNNL